MWLRFVLVAHRNTCCLLTAVADKCTLRPTAFVFDFMLCCLDSFLPIPPKTLKHGCLNAVVSIWNLTGRVFDFDTAHNLDRLGGHKILDASAYLKACLIRAAYNMYDDPDSQCLTL